MKFFARKKAADRAGFAAPAISAKLGGPSAPPASPANVPYDARASFLDVPWTRRDRKGEGATKLTALVTDEFQSWWARDYSVAALRERGEYDIWEAIEAPVFKFAGKEWTIFHMPLCDLEGNPSPKFLMSFAREGYGWWIISRVFNLRQSDAEKYASLCAQHSDQNAADFFCARSSVDRFERGVQDYLAASVRASQPSTHEEDDNPPPVAPTQPIDIRLEGLVFPAPFELNQSEESVSATRFGKIRIDHCQFFGDFTVSGFRGGLIGLERCSIFERVSLQKCDVGIAYIEDFFDMLGPEAADQHQDLAGRQAIRLEDIRAHVLSVFDCPLRNVIMARCVVAHQCVIKLSATETRTVRLTECDLGDVSIVASTRELRSIVNLVSHNTIFSGTLEIISDTLSTGVMSVYGGEAIGPIQLYGVTLHPSSSFSDVDFLIDDQIYVNRRAGAISKNNFLRKELFGPNSGQEEFDPKDASVRYILAAENGYRHLRKLAKDNKQTDYELLFYAKQFEARALRSDLKRHERALMFVYRWTSAYGTSLVRPIVSFAVMGLSVVALAVGVAILGGVDRAALGDVAGWAGSQVLPEMPPPIQRLDAPASLVDAVGGRVGYLYGAVVAIKITAFAFIALFVIALRRRFQIE